MSETPKKQASGWKRFWTGVWRFIVWLVRLLFALGLGVLLGLAIFYIAHIGVPQFYDQVLNPIQVNRVKLEILEGDVRNTQAALNTELRTTQQQLRALQQTASSQQAEILMLRTELEAEKSNRVQFQDILASDVQRLDQTTQFQGIQLSELDSTTETAVGSLAASLAELTDQHEEIEATVDALLATSSAMARDVSSLQDRLASAEKDIEESSAQLAALGEELMSVSGAVAATSADLLDLRQVVTMPITLADALERRLILMQAWQNVFKAKLDLLEGNAGLATNSLALAEAYVRQYVALSTDLPEGTLAPILARMEATRPYIESDPFVALQDLEVIWHQLEVLVAPKFAAVEVPEAEAPAAEEATEATEATEAEETEAAEETETTGEEEATEEEAAEEEAPAAETPTPAPGG